MSTNVLRCHPLPKLKKCAQWYVIVLNNRRVKADALEDHVPITTLSSFESMEALLVSLGEMNVCAGVPRPERYQQLIDDMGASFGTSVDGSTRAVVERDGNFIGAYGKVDMCIRATSCSLLTTHSTCSGCDEYVCTLRSRFSRHINGGRQKMLDATSLCHTKRMWESILRQRLHEEHRLRTASEHKEAVLLNKIKALEDRQFQNERST